MTPDHNHRASRSMACLPPTNPMSNQTHSPLWYVLCPPSFKNLSLIDYNNYQNFPNFDPSFPVDPSFVPPPHSPPESVKHSASSDATNSQHTRPTSYDGDEAQFADPTLGRSSSEEKESAPGQSKRKAQNRAAYVIYQTRSEPSILIKQALMSPTRYTVNEHFESEKNSTSAISKKK